MGKAENVIEQRLRKKVERGGGICWKFVSPAKNGVPDRIVAHRGRVVFIETKAAGGRLSSLQKVRIAELRAAQIDVRVLWTAEQVDAFVDELFA